LTQAGLTDALDNEGFAGLYDFIFLPTSVRSGRSSRYAIVNFLRHSYGLSLAAHFYGRTDWGAGECAEACKVKWSLPQQGLQELVELYRNDPTMHASVAEHLRPALYSSGWQVPMPSPTKYLRGPPLRAEAHHETGRQVPQITAGPAASAQEEQTQIGSCGDGTADVFELAAPSQWPGLASSGPGPKKVRGLA